MRGKGCEPRHSVATRRRSDLRRGGCLGIFYNENALNKYSVEYTAADGKPHEWIVEADGCTVSESGALMFWVYEVPPGAQVAAVSNWSRVSKVLARCPACNAK